MNKELSHYIEENLAKGISRDSIIASLQSAGWQINDIEKSFPSPKKVSLFAKLSPNLASLCIRVGLAFVFVYATTTFISQSPSVGGRFVPDLIKQIIPLNIFLPAFGIFEIILSLWLLSGQKVKYAGLIVAIVITIVTVANPSQFPTLFRNIPIITAGLALFFLK